MKTLSELNQTYPLPPGWSALEVHESELELGPVKLQVVGLCSQNSKSLELTGSAVSFQSDAFVRAYFELIERIAILEWRSNLENPHAPNRPVLNSKLQVDGSIPTKTLFPQEPQGSSWKYSHSNGVAAHISLEQACHSAASELIERDRLLRSWYGEFKPWPFPLLEHPTLSSLQNHFEIEAFHFGENVIALFGFPKNSKDPLLMGHASAQTKEMLFLEP